jgi:hypothetical protein
MAVDKNSFMAFANRVMSAARVGRLGAKDVKSLEGLLSKAGTRNAILASAILSALSGSGDQKDIGALAEILSRADGRIENGIAPLSPEDRKSLEEIFNRNMLSGGAARKFELSLDSLLLDEMKANMPQERKAAHPPYLAQKEQEKKQEQAHHNIGR